jgi:hypothetical protein
MDQLDLIRAFRRTLPERRPDARERARQALVARMAGPQRVARRRWRPPGGGVRTALAGTAALAATAGVVAAAMLGGPASTDRSPARPTASVASSEQPAEPTAQLSSSYRDYLRFASRMIRLELRTGPERGAVPMGIASFCGRSELGAIERLVIQTLTASGVPRGAPAPGVELAGDLTESSGLRPCRYADFGVERARAVYSGQLPTSNLMPEAQAALTGQGLVAKPLL